MYSKPCNSSERVESIVSKGVWEDGVSPWTCMGIPRNIHGLATDVPVISINIRTLHEYPFIWQCPIWFVYDSVEIYDSEKSWSITVV